MVLKRKRLEATLSLARYTRDVLPMLGNAMEEKHGWTLLFSRQWISIVKGHSKSRESD